MRIRPILFNGDMVRAILDGRKTCTRRVVKTRSKDACGFYVTKKADGSVTGVYEYDEDERMLEYPLMPPYQPGDILYVRETVWRETGYYVDINGEIIITWHNKFRYVASDKKTEPWGTCSWIKCPSIHMPKEAARIWLRVTDVRVERLQDITPKDAKNEGVGDLFYDDIGYSDKDYGTEVDPEYGVAKEQFAWLWDSTIKKAALDCYGWDANPWVWVIEFERCEKPEESEK